MNYSMHQGIYTKRIISGVSLANTAIIWHIIHHSWYSCSTLSKDIILPDAYDWICKSQSVSMGTVLTLLYNMLPYVIWLPCVVLHKVKMLAKVSKELNCSPENRLLKKGYFWPTCTQFLASTDTDNWVNTPNHWILFSIKFFDRIQNLVYAYHCFHLNRTYTNFYIKDLGP